MGFIDAIREIIADLRDYFNNRQSNRRELRSSPPSQIAKNVYSASPTQVPIERLTLQSFPVPARMSAGEEDQDLLVQWENEGLLIYEHQLEFNKEIGRGFFGTVYEAVLDRGRFGKGKVAVKTVRNVDLLVDETFRELLKESKLMQTMKHPNILRLVGVCFREEKFPELVLPYMENGDLHTYLTNEDNTLYVTTLLKFATEVAMGMSYMEDNKYVHRDLAARNCLLNEKNNVKVADFGLTRDIYEKNYYKCETRRCLPMKWMAIESLEKGIFTTKSDVWSYGVLLWEVMTRGVMPYRNVENGRLLETLKQGNRMSIPQYCPIPVYQVMLACCHPDAEKRPAFSEIVKITQSIGSTIQKNVRFKNVKTAAKNNIYYNFNPGNDHRHEDKLYAEDMEWQSTTEDTGHYLPMH